MESSDPTVSVCKKNAENWSEQDKVEERWVKDISELNSFFVDAIVPGQPRGFFKDGLFPDIVVSGTGSLSLNLVDQVIVEQHPNGTSHFATLNLLINEVWPKPYRRPDIVVKRSNCKTYCACKNLESFNAKIEPLFSFASWEEKYSKHFPSKKHSALP